MSTVRFMLAATAACAGLCCLQGCTKSEPKRAAADSSSGGTSETASVAVITPTSAPRTAPSLPKPVDPMVVLHTTAGDITLQLFAEKSPRTVENFLQGYVQRGYYDQTIFHHIEPGQMLIGGGFTADFERKPARTPIYNESRNGLSNRRGAVAMIREPDAPHSATSEFFINLSNNPDLDYRSGDDDVPGYCVFGEVITGMDVIDRIAQLPTTTRGEFQRVPSPLVSITSVERLQ